MKTLIRTVLICLLCAFLSPVYADDLSDANEYFMTGQYSKAIQSYERALGSASDKAKINYNLGVCYEKLGNYERAKSYYRSAGNFSDAPAAVNRMDKRIKDRQIANLRRQAQSAYDEMNYGTAAEKAEEILELDPNNSWAKGFMQSLGEVGLGSDQPESTIVVDTSSVAEDTVVIDTSAVETVEPSEWKAFSFSPFPSILWIIIIFVILAALVVAAYLFGKSSGKETVEKAMITLLKLLPAGMVSVRKNDKISMLFFEKGKVIKAIIEETDGVKIGGRSVAEELLGTSCEYQEKPEGPWSKFAELMVEVYRRAQVESDEAKPSHKKSSARSRRSKKK